MKNEITWRHLLAIARRVRRSLPQRDFGIWKKQVRGLLQTGQWVILPTSTVNWRKPTVLGGQ